MHMMAIIAKTIPVEILIERLTVELENYKQATLLDDEEAEKDAHERLCLACKLFSMKDSIKDLSLTELAKELTNIDQAKGIIASMNGDNQIKPDDHESTN